jgi:hypothetical protein
MKIPDQAPPVQRVRDPSLVCQVPPSQTNTIQFSSLDQTGGINPAGYEECYSLPGLAQQLCLLAYY